MRSNLGERSQAGGESNEEGRTEYGNVGRSETNGCIRLWREAES